MSKVKVTWAVRIFVLRAWGILVDQRSTISSWLRKWLAGQQDITSSNAYFLLIELLSTIFNRKWIAINFCKRACLKISSAKKLHVIMFKHQWVEGPFYVCFAQVHVMQVRTLMNSTTLALLVDRTLTRTNHGSMTVNPAPRERSLTWLEARSALVSCRISMRVS